MRNNNKKQLPVISSKIVADKIKFSSIIPQVSRKRKKFFAFLGIAISLLILAFIAIFLSIWF